MSKGVKVVIVLVILAGLAVAGYFFLHSYAKGKAEENVAAFFSQVQDVAQAEYGEVEVDLLGQAAVIHDMQLSVLGGKTFSVEEFVLRDYEEEMGWPKSMDFSVRGVKVPVTEANMEDAYQTFADLGMQEVTFDFDMAYDFDQGDDSFELSDLSLNMRGLGSLGMSFGLENVDFRTLVVTEGASAMTIALSGAEIRFTDDAFVDMALKASALEQGKTPEQVMEEGMVEIDNEIAMARENGDTKAIEVLEAVKRFVENPGTIAVTIRPKHPVGLMGLMEITDFASAVDALNISIESR